MLPWSRALASRLIAIIYRDNLASQRVAKKIGMHVNHELAHPSPVRIVCAMDLQQR